METEHEIKLEGGRLTENVTRKGAHVCRPLKPNSEFVHKVLMFLEANKCRFAPRFHGIDSDSREILDYIDGDVPVAPFHPTEKQCCEAAVIIRTLHTTLANYPDCIENQTVCHNDLHPSNFVFRNDIPIAVFDWDMASVGAPLHDLAFAVWMWVNIDNSEDDTEFAAEVNKMHRMLDAYGLPMSDIPVLCECMINRMKDVGSCVFSTEAKTLDIKAWTENCQEWVSRYKRYSGIS